MAENKYLVEPSERHKDTYNRTFLGDQQQLQKSLQISLSTLLTYCDKTAQNWHLPHLTDRVVLSRRGVCFPRIHQNGEYRNARCLARIENVRHGKLPPIRKFVGRPKANLTTWGYFVGIEAFELAASQASYLAIKVACS
jgi:hypothetical protein